MNDLTGKVFDKLKVIEYVGDRKWKCLCECGNYKNIHAYSLTSGKTKSCGKCKTKEVKVGDLFGEWEVTDIVSDTHVLCECSCGNVKEVNKYTLLSGRSKGCGHTKNRDRVIDMSGEKYGKLTVKEYIGDGQWACSCECGGTKIARRSKLLSGVTWHCGCENVRLNDLKDKKFGMLTAIEYVGDKKWNCKCDCGNYKVIRAANLLNESTVSCGCLLNKFTTYELDEKIYSLTEKLGRKPFLSELAKYIGINRRAMGYHINEHELKDKLNNSFSSDGEREVAELFNDENTILGSKSIIPPYELDIYLPDRQLAVEFNGSYWHSEIHKDPYYHQRKTMECAKQGIRLIHIFEYEWQDDTKRPIIESILNKDKNVIYGRNTIIETIDVNRAREFLNKNHLQGYISAEVYLGCIDKSNGELVGIMSLGTPRFNNCEDYEIYRLAWKLNTIVIGGKEKLFKYFISNYDVKSIITYVDISKFTGNGYTNLGFKTTKDCITKPNYVWYNSSVRDVRTRYQTQKHKLVEMFWGNKEETEDEIMRRLGYNKIYNSGNLKLVWNRE